MARPIKRGLDYFSLDCHLDDKAEYVEAKHGLLGYAILVKLWTKIYKSEGYFCEWKEKNAYLFCKDIGVELTIVNDVVNTCFEENLFCKELYEKHSILTSKGIQKRWLKIVTEAKRKDVSIDKQYSLLGFTPEETELTPEETPKKPAKTPEESTQSKVKKIKGNKSKEGKDKKQPLKSAFEKAIESDLVTLPDEFKLVWDDFQRWLKSENIVKVQLLEKPLTPCQLNTLITKFGLKPIQEKLMGLENRKNMEKEYTSVYLTINGWLSRDFKDGSLQQRQPGLFSNQQPTPTRGNFNQEEMIKNQATKKYL